MTMISRSITFDHPTDQPAPPLADSALFVQRAYVGGTWRDADTGAVETVTNPATGAVLGTVPALGAAETEAAIRAADTAYRPWRRLLAKERGAILARWAELMRSHAEDLAVLMTLEQGKPLAESRGEIDYARGFLSWFAGEAERQYGDTQPGHLPGARVLVTREPVGVTAAITPWNFPAAMITRKAGAALAAGCPMIVKPALETPYSALALAVLAERAGMPVGVFQVLTGSARVIGKALTDSPVVRKISFTGSTEVGRLLLAQSADTVKKVSMELGGHAPFIVLPDADLDKAVSGAVAAKFATTGQDCLAANRIFVPANRYDAFAARFAEATAALKVGDGLKPGVMLGPLMNEAAVRKCEAHITDAVAKGATVLTGGKRHLLGGLFFEPTVLGAITEDMAIFQEETFGPVAALCRYDSEEEVIRRANDSIFGLAAYLYGRDMGAIFRVAEALEYGMVGINTPKFTGPSIPFGGMKQSGLGREGSKYGLDDYTELKYWCLSGIDA